jgi:spoIIIJ-associated protein
MKDRVFTGQDVPAALAEAASVLGLPEAELRYVVLDAGSEGVRGLQPTPARVAVLAAKTSEPHPSHHDDAPPKPQPVPSDPRAGIRATIRAVAEAAGIDVSAEISEGEERVIVRLGGPDHAFFFGEDGRGDVLRATEHVLQRTYGREFFPKSFRVDCEGFQEKRDEALGDDARQLADAVRGDGRPRTTEPLNAYERRIVHVALTEAADVTTYSVGTGPARRVTVALAEEQASAEADRSPSASADSDESPPGE